MPNTGYDSDVEFSQEGQPSLRHGGKWTGDVDANLPKEQWLHD